MLRLKNTFFNNFNNSRKADSKFNLEYVFVCLFAVFQHLQEGHTDALHMLDVFIIIVSRST